MQPLFPTSYLMVESLGTKVQKSVVESTAAYFTLFPISVAAEKLAAGMSHLESFITRLESGAATYVIVPLLQAGRSYLFEHYITSEKSRKWFDKSVVGLSMLGIKTAAYVGGNYHADGSVEWGEVAVGVAIPTAVGLWLGDKIFKLMGASKELFGLEPYDHLPLWLREKSQAYRLWFATGFLTASLATGMSIYACTPDSSTEKELEQKVRTYTPPQSSYQARTFDISAYVSPSVSARSI